MNSTAKIDWINRLCKWRTVFTGWQLGTRPKGDPEADAVRDHREVTLLLRAEQSAIVGLLIKKGVFTREEWQAAFEDECRALDRMCEQRFPGFKSFEGGMSISPEIARDTMAGWKP